MTDTPKAKSGESTSNKPLASVILSLCCFACVPGCSSSPPAKYTVIDHTGQKHEGLVRQIGDMYRKPDGSYVTFRGTHVTTRLPEASEGKR